jgi:hypothetical protein
MIGITLKNPKNDKSKKKIQDCIDKAMQILTVREDGRVTHKDETQFGVYVDIIARQISDIEHLDRGSIDAKRRLVRSALTRLRKYKQHTYVWFVRALDIQARHYLQNNPISPFTVVFFANVQSDAFGERRSINILDECLFLRSWNWLKKYLEISKFQQDTFSPFGATEYLLGVTSLTMTIESRESLDAGRSAIRLYDYFRALVNYVVCYGSLYFSTEPRPLARILPSPFCPVFDSEGKYATHLVTYERYEHPLGPLAPSAPLKQEHLEKAIELTESLKRPSSQDDIMDLLLAVIQRYGEGLDATNPQMAYLAMWQALEAVALRSKTDDVRKRIDLIFKQDMRYLLEVVAEVRNSFVHSGHFSPGGLTETHFIKIVAENIVRYLFGILDVLPTRSALEEFYTQAACDTPTLKVRRRVLDRILKGRDDQE